MEEFIDWNTEYRGFNIKIRPDIVGFKYRIKKGSFKMKHSGFMGPNTTLDSAHTIIDVLLENLESDF